MYTLIIHLPINPPETDPRVGGWGDVENFLGGVAKEGFVKSVGSGVELERTNDGQHEVVTFLTSTVEEAVKFFEATYAAQVANGSDISKATLDDAPMFTLVWQYRRALNNTLRLVKRMPGRSKGAKGVRLFIESSLTELPKDK